MASASLLLLMPQFSNPRTRNLSCCLSLDHTRQNRSSEVESKTSRTIATDDLRVVFAAGGTGGHIIPAVAIADELKSLNPSVQILFAGTKTGMESTAVPSAGHPFVSVSAFPLIRPLLSPKNVLFPFRLIKSVVESWKVLSEFDPQIVVGTGGYVSAPVCLAAAFRGLNVVIQEQNSVPGTANWMLSWFADLVFVAFPSSVRYFPRNKCIVSGNPIRLCLRRYVSKAVARVHFFPRVRKTWDSEAKVVLVLGGSLGADAINMAVLNMYYNMLLEHKNIFLIWQTGIGAFDEMDSLVKNHPQLVLTPFLHTMDLAYAAADLVVSRAGAMTCSEILATGKPSILIPSPNVAEGHQLKNASIMEELAGSKIITEDELDSSTLKIAIEDVLGDESQMAEMCNKALKAARPDATAEIAQHIISLGQSSAAKRK